MIRVKGKNIITGLLNESQRQGAQLLPTFKSYLGNRIQSLETFKRWKERTFGVIHKYVNDIEATKFWDLPTNSIYSFPNTPFFWEAQISSEIAFHTEFIKSLVLYIEENNINIKFKEFEDRAGFILMMLNLESNKGKSSVYFPDLADAANINKRELFLYLLELRTKSLITFEKADNKSIRQKVEFINISLEGVKAAQKHGDKILKENSKSKQNYMENYAEKECAVLRAINEIGKASQDNEVNFYDLLKAVNLPYQELSTMIDELENRKGFIRCGSDECVKISPAGIEFLQGKSNIPSGNNITNYHIKGSVGAIQHQTQNSRQSVNQQLNKITNPEFNDAINSISELIRNSSLSAFAKEDLISDIERIKQLAEIESSPELAEHAKSKINYLETAIKVTDLATKLSPYFPILYSYFEKLTQ